MKILNMGSLNYDFDYSVEEIVKPGETIHTTERITAYGGKGFNQSVALKNAGADVYHCGILGAEGGDFLTELERRGLSTKYIKKDPSGSSGHAIIQIDSHGQNCIIVYPGTNYGFDEEFIDSVLSDFSAGDILVLQNEINCLSRIVDKAYERSMRIVLNPSPVGNIAAEIDLHKISLLVVNESEARAISGASEDPGEALRRKFPNTAVLMTLGSEGSVFMNGNELIRQRAYPVKAVDTTAAGDTFLGFFLAFAAKGNGIEKAMDAAARASSIAVTRRGAAVSVPTAEEI